MTQPSEDPTQPPNPWAPVLPEEPEVRVGPGDRVTCPDLVDGPGEPPD